jgi:hypothetical protein
LGQADEQAVIFPIEGEARTKGSQNGADRDVGAVELIGHAPFQWDADARRAALDDERALFDPDPVGQARQNRIRRRYDAPIQHEGRNVAREGMAVE